jgi:N-acetylglucosamine kinase-like BadF-type ATPase
MIIICESGSTKADWILINKESKYQTDTIGINPLFHNENQIMDIIKSNELLISKSGEISKIFFYGTSCSNEDKVNRVSNALKSVFTNAQIVEVKHDLDGAAFAVSKTVEISIVNIIGTGSNSCLFDGKKIIDQIGGNGYILSDEASGAYFGKRLCGDYLIKMMPTEIIHYFEDELKVDRDIIINKVYREPNANVYLASYAHILSKFSDTEYIQQLIYSGFDEFMKKHVCRFDNFEKYPVHFIGSIAFYCKDILNKVCIDNHAQLGNIIQKPIEGLVNYHQAAID